jgi:hypothetical protein
MTSCRNMKRALSSSTTKSRRDTLGICSAVQVWAQGNTGAQSCYRVMGTRPPLPPVCAASCFSGSPAPSHPPLPTHLPTHLLCHKLCGAAPALKVQHQRQVAGRQQHLPYVAHVHAAAAGSRLDLQTGMQAGRAGQAGQARGWEMCTGVPALYSSRPANSTRTGLPTPRLPCSPGCC